MICLQNTFFFFLQKTANKNYEHGEKKQPQAAEKKRVQQWYFEKLSTILYKYKFR